MLKFAAVARKVLNVALMLGLCLPAAQPVSAASGSIQLNVDAAAGQHAIRPEIYGLNFAKESFAQEIGLPLRRWGGNATSRYNWQNGATNTAMDWFFENVTQYDPYTGLAEAHTAWIAQNQRTSSASLLTIPMLGYVAKDNSSCSFSHAKYGSQQAYDLPWRPDCGNGLHTDGSLLSGNNPLDASRVADTAFMQAWVQSLVATYGPASAGGVRYYALDNEPDLWGDTHRDVHPNPQSYDELLAKTLATAATLKTADPSAQVLGYSSFGWTGYWYSEFDTLTAASNGYTYFPDKATHGDQYQVPWYLSQLRQYELTHGTRLLDYLDLHYYPENGVALTAAGSASQQALRLRSTRALWDPTYIDESWIGGSDQPTDWQSVHLIPRMRDWVQTYYPGTKLAITEYNFGGLESINGALTQADALGIFGREGLDLATLWNYPLLGGDPLGYDHFESLPGSYAFRIYRNYDGAGSRFGDLAVQASSSDQSQLSVYAARRTSDSSLTMEVINKTGGSLNATLNLANFQSGSNASVYRYSAADLGSIQHLADQPLGATGYNAAYPANSITLLVLPNAAASTFADVPSTYWANSYIEILAANGVTSGCSLTPKLYCPASLVTRAEMAVFLLRAEHGASYIPPAVSGVFADVPAGYWAAAWIEQLFAEGITSGCGASPLRYCPDSPVNRDQMAIFLLRAKHGSAYIPPSSSGLFADVPVDYWDASWIEQLAAEGITSGCSTTPLRYCPASAVSRDQMAVFLVRSFNLH